MHCLRPILIFSLLIPMPSVSPFLLLVLGLIAYWTMRPCGYCTTVIAILFFSTSPSSPFLTHLSPSPTPPPDNTLPLDSPIPNRGAFYLNGLRFFDPTLVGYREMSRVWDDVVSGHEEVDVDGLGWWPGKWKLGMSSRPKDAESEAPAQGEGAEAVVEATEEVVEVEQSGGKGESVEERGPESKASNAEPTQAPLPKHYYDLRVGGMGFVIDLGWRRTDEGLRWEVEDTRRAAALNRPSSRVKHDVPEAQSTEEPQRAQPQHTGWLRSSFAGSW